MSARQILISCFNAAVTASDPARTIARHLPPRPKGRTIVVGAGKAAAKMAAALEATWDGPLEGCVVTRYGYGTTTQRIAVIEAAHPIPDEAGLRASEHLLRLVAGLTADDLVIALISGGGSALLPCPADGLLLEDEIAVNQILFGIGRTDSCDEHGPKTHLQNKGGASGGGGVARPGCIFSRFRYSG